MKAIYVDEIIYNFLKSQKKDYGSYNNVVKAILRKLGELQEEISSLKSKTLNDEGYIKEVLLESVRHPQQISTSAYSGGNKTMNVVPTGPPIPLRMPKKDGFAKELQMVFNALGEGEGVKPSDFLKKQDEMKKLSPPPPPPNNEVIMLEASIVEKVPDTPELNESLSPSQVEE